MSLTGNMTRKQQKQVAKAMKGQGKTRKTFVDTSDVVFTRKENVLKNLAKKKFFRGLREEDQERYDELIKQLGAREVIYDPYHKVHRVVY